MAFSDAQRISKEQHELDYVLRKWDRRTTKANRDILSVALDAFNSDESLSDHDRDAFYRWADKTGLKDRLEARSTAAAPNFESTQVADSLAAAPSASVDAGAAPLTQAFRSPGPAPSSPGRMPYWLKILLFVLALLVILFILFFVVRSCGDNSGRTGETPAQSVPVAPTNEEIQTDNSDAPSVAPAAIVLQAGTVDEKLLVFRFEPDSTNRMLPGEEEKLLLLAAALKGFEGGCLQVDGHAASIGYPAGERRVSEARAMYIVRALREAGLSEGIILDTAAYGAEKPLAGNDHEEGRRLNRRVALSIREAD